MVSIIPDKKKTLKAFPDKKLSVFSQDQAINTFDLKGDTKIVEPLNLVPPKASQPLVIFFFGRRGEGKTLAMTTIAKLMKERYLKRGHNNEVYSNYWTSFGKWSPWLVDQLTEFPAWAKNGIIAVDEVSSAFPSARAMSQVNVLFTNMLTQIRKRNLECLFTTQFPSTVSHGLLMQVDLFIMCQKIKGGKAIKLYCFDFWGQWTGNFGKKRWPPMIGEQDWELTLHNTDRMFGSYRTDEVVASVFSDTRDDVIGQQYDFEDQSKVEVQDVTPIDPDDPIDQIIVQLVGSSEHIDVRGVLTHIKDSEIDKSIKALKDLEPYFQRYGFEYQRINNKIYAVKGEE